MPNDQATTTERHTSKTSTTDAYEDLKDQAGSALDEIKKVGTSGKKLAEAGAHAAADRAGAARDDVKQSARSLEQTVLDYVEREPYRALAMAAGVGALVGLWLRRK